MSMIRKKSGQEEFFFYFYFPDRPTGPNGLVKNPPSRESTDQGLTISRRINCLRNIIPGFIYLPFFSSLFYTVLKKVKFCLLGNKIKKAQMPTNLKPTRGVYKGAEVETDINVLDGDVCPRSSLCGHAQEAIIAEL